MKNSNPQALQISGGCRGNGKLLRYCRNKKLSMLNRECVTGALVFGNQVLLGAIPMEDMDFNAEPGKFRVSVNPLSPNIPLSLA